MVEYGMIDEKDQATKEEWKRTQRNSMQIQALRNEDNVYRSELKSGLKSKK